MKKRILSAALAAALLAGCGKSAALPASTEAAASTAEAEEVLSASGNVFAMDTFMTVTCYGDRCEEALKAATAEIERIDNLLSVGNPDSEVSKVNAAGYGTLGADASAMTAEALRLYQTTGGAFDMTVYPLMELWGFTTGDFAVPSDEALAETLAKVGSDKVTFDASTGEITLGEGQGMDLGGIAKGYTSTRLMEIFEEYGLVSGLVSLGGNVQCYKTKPDGSLWKVGIIDPNHPDDTSQLMGVLQLDGKAVITSGGYERYFTDEATGKTYHHIIDPKTGVSADSGLTSVSIVTADGTLADGLSTALYVLGLDGAEDYWRNSGDEFDMILMDKDNTVYITEGLAEDFTTDYELVILEK